MILTILICLLIGLIVIGGIVLTGLYYENFGWFLGYFMTKGLWECIGCVITGLIECLNKRE